MTSNQAFIGATCTGCGEHSSHKLGTVAQRDLGSADKWHARCYRDAERAKRETLTLTAVYVRRYADDDGWDHDEWKVVLRYKGRQMTTPFKMGTGHHGAAPTVDLVAENMFSNAVEAGTTFGEWAGDYGYDTDSRKAEATFKACKTEDRRFRQLLGDDYDTVRAQIMGDES